MSTNSAMTTRDFLNAVINGDISENVISKASEMLVALDARNEKRRASDSKEKQASASRRDAVLAFLREHEGAFTRDQIANEIGMEPSKVTGACTSLVTNGYIVKSKVKTDKSTHIAYSVA